MTKIPILLIKNKQRKALSSHVATWIKKRRKSEREGLYTLGSSPVLSLPTPFLISLATIKKNEAKKIKSQQNRIKPIDKM